MEPKFDWSEKRDHVRHEVKLQVTFLSDSNFYTGLSENLSEGGLFIATHVPLPLGTKVEVRFFVPDYDEEIVGIGEVRWLREYSKDNVDPPGMGLRFESLSEVQQNAINTFLSKREPVFYEDE